MMFGFSAWQALPQEPYHLDVLISEDFDYADQTNIRRAATLWEDAIPTLHVHFKRTGINPWVRIVPATEAEITRIFEADTGKHQEVVGLFKPLPGDGMLIQLATDTDRKCFTQIVGHELGHAMGLLDDYKNEGALMYWVVKSRGPEGPTPRDVRAWYGVRR